jgi:hypothetical protein
MKKLIATTAAAGILVAGVFVASNVTAAPASAQTAGTPTVESSERPDRPDRGQIFDDVMDGLVADGTIDQGQADAIRDAFSDKRAEIGEEFGPRPDRGRGFQRGALRGLMADGVITAEEIAALPEDHPLRTGDSPLSELLEDDGQITQDEFDAFREEHGSAGRRQQDDANQDSQTG